MKKDFQEILDPAPQPRRRRLRKGEKIDLSCYGIPGVSLSGQGQEIFEYPDGTREPIIKNLGTFLRAAFIMLLLDDSHALDQTDVRFIRKHMNLTQDDFGAMLNLSRETINRLESGKESISSSVSGNLRYHGLQFLMLENKKGEDKKIEAIKKLSLIGEALASIIDKMKNEMPSNTKLELLGFNAS